MSAPDDIALDRETVDAQCEVMPRAPLRMLTCGHEKHTHRVTTTKCRQCFNEPRPVLTPEECRARAATSLRAAREFENHALIARQRAAAYQRHADHSRGDTGR